MRNHIIAVHSLTSCFLALFNTIFRCFLKPARTSVVLAAVIDLSRSKADLITENALLCQQLLILHGQTKRQQLTLSDHFRLLVLATWVRTWRQVLMIVQPATLLRRCRQGIRSFWKLKSKAGRKHE